MTIEDLILALALELPLHEERFTDELDVIDMTRDGNNINVRTSEPHGLLGRHGVTLHGTLGLVDIVSITDSTTGYATVVCVRNHDITLSIKTTVRFEDTGSALVDATTFTILRIEDALTFIIKMAPATYPSPLTAGFVKDAGTQYNSYDGTYPVDTVISELEFAIRDDRPTNPAPDFTDAVIRSGVRVSGGVDLERCIAAYTSQGDGKWWMFVIPEDVHASKDRELRTDSVSDTGDGEFFQQKVIQPISLYTIIATPQDAAARQARDDCEKMFQGICKSILMRKFDSYFGVGSQGNLQFMSHGRAFYDGAVYVHAFSFQQTCDLSDRDVYVPQGDSRFNSFSLELVPSLGTGDETMQTADVQIVDLD